jgi:hypothetical protein
MLRRDTLFGAYVAENTQLLFVVSTHTSFLTPLPVETRVVFQHPARAAPEGSYYMQLLRAIPKAFQKGRQKPVDTIRSKEDMEFRL